MDLKRQLKRLKVTICQIGLENKIQSLRNFDLLITAGGGSKGKYDLIKEVLKNVKAKILFNQIAMKPGKPTTFSKTDKFFGTI